MTSTQQQHGSILITGANGGLGSALVSRIAGDSALASYTGIYSVRKEATATQLKATLSRSDPRHQHHVVEMDLCSIGSVKRAAIDINTRIAKGELPPIRALILAAAYQDQEKLTFTEDGYEISWHANYLSNQILLMMLLESMDKEEGRIMTIGSWSHDVDDVRNDKGGISPYEDPKWHNTVPSAEEVAKGRWSTPEDDPSYLSGLRRYGSSKLCETMLTFELNERIAKDPKLSNISVLCLDPGGMSTGLSRRGSLSFRLQTGLIHYVAPILLYFQPNGDLRTTKKSAGDIIRGCFEIEAPRPKMLYLNGYEEMEAAKETKNERKRRELWEYGVAAAAIGREDTALAAWQ